MSDAVNRRILVVDDNPSIHQDFQKILASSGRAQAVHDAKAAFFGVPAPAKPKLGGFEVDSAYQGQEALAKIEGTLKSGQRYAMAFVDVRMPPGWDGVETIARLWQVDPDLQVVICTAFADYSWDDMIEKLGQSDRLLILKKPFDPVEACQLASALTEKWNSVQRERLRIEDAKRAEQEARAYAASLKTINRALETAKARSEAAAVAKSAFLINLSEKIRAPMRAIREGIESLCEPNLSEQRRIDNARALGCRSASLCTVFDNIGDYSRIESGELEIVRQPCSPSAIAEQVVARLAPQAEEKGLRLAVECPKPIPETIQTDALRLCQALENVVNNAIRYTDAGSVRIVLEIGEREEWREPEIVFQVIDTGVGIAPEEQGRLFEPFQQSDGPSAQCEGTRLGLALSKRLCQMLGGDIGVESDPGSGSRFTLRVQTGDLTGVRMLEYPRALLPTETDGALRPS